ncbi:hypothetical protein ACFLVS_03175, partial [Chloroflexota bacterium]
ANTKPGRILMNILNILKKKYEEDIKKTVDDPKGRKQLNIKVDYRMIAKIKRLSAEFAVPRYVAAEYALEVGYFYLNRTLANRKKREVLRNHLINRHLLDNGYDDPEEILRIGEGRYASELISLAKNVMRDYGTVERAMAIAKKDGNFNSIDVARKKILKSTLTLADWLHTHPLEDHDT